MQNKNNIPNLLMNAAPVTIEKAKRLRQRLTASEKKLWSYLRNRRLGGLKFRRQHPIDRYIVDFICIEKKLVIELDGGIHNTLQQREYDQQRTETLQTYDLTVIRFKNEAVINNIHKVLEEIRKSINL